MIAAEGYRDQLLALLPPGVAWSRDPKSTIGSLLAGFGDGFARLDGRVDRLLLEADPGTALELLPDWERVAGLPDTCIRRPGTVAERRLAVVGRITDRGGQSIAYLTAFAANYGYTVSIEEGRSADVGTMRCGDRLGGHDWRHAWTARVELAADASVRSGVFAIGRSRAGDRLATFGAFDLECLFARVKPAHTIVQFAYDPGD
jgi:uncharacterized protein YmfQ (DUF2313 family)